MTTNFFEVGECPMKRYIELKVKEKKKQREIWGKKLKELTKLRMWWYILLNWLHPHFFDEVWTMGKAHGLAELAKTAVKKKFVMKRKKPLFSEELTKKMKKGIEKHQKAQEDLGEHDKYVEELHKEGDELAFIHVAALKAYKKGLKKNENSN